MTEDDWLEIMHLLSDDEYLTESLIPINCFFITQILKQLDSCLEDMNVFSLAKLDSSISFFYSRNKQNTDLLPYVSKLEYFTSSKFSVEDIVECKCIFDELNMNYKKKYSNRITATTLII